MNILVTGGTGFIGGAILETLKEKEGIEYNFSVFAPSRKEVDLTNKEAVKELFKTEFSHIFHYAANPLTDINKTTLDSIYQSNVQSTLNLLDSIPKDQKPRFIFASSVTVYSDKDLAFGAVEAHPPYPSSIYGATKLACEAVIGAFGQMGKISPLIIRYCAICGPSASHGVLKDLCRKYKEDEIVEVIGQSPGTSKCFVHIDDAITATFKLAFSKHEGIYNVGNLDTLSVEEILSIIRTKLGKKEEKWSGATWVGDNKSVRVDNLKTWTRIRWFPRKTREAVELAISEILGGQ